MIREEAIGKIGQINRYFSGLLVINFTTSVPDPVEPPPPPPSVGDGFFRFRIRPLRRTWFGFNKPNDDAQ